MRRFRLWRGIPFLHCHHYKLNLDCPVRHQSSSSFFCHPYTPFFRSVSLLFGNYQPNSPPLFKSSLRDSTQPVLDISQQSYISHATWTLQITLAAHLSLVCHRSGHFFLPQSFHSINHISLTDILDQFSPNTHNLRLHRLTMD